MGERLYRGHTDEITRDLTSQLYTRGRHETGVVLHAALAGAQADPRGIRAERHRGSLYLDDISIGRMDDTADTVGGMPFFQQRELANIGIAAMNSSKTIDLPPKRHIPTPEKNISSWRH